MQAPIGANYVNSLASKYWHKIFKKPEENVLHETYLSSIFIMDDAITFLLLLI